MRSWRRCLDAAGASEQGLRADYMRVARFMQRREPAGYVAVRWLAPADFQPHVLAGYAFASFTDDLCDRGTVEERTRRFDEWARAVRAALESGESGHPLVRAFLHTAAARALPHTWVDSYLEGARIDLAFSGFATEGDYQRYVDQLTWPFLMITSGLARHGGGSPEFADACRLLADAGQRTDILTDMAEDLRAGRLYLPASALEQHGVTPTDLALGRDTPGVRALITSCADMARATLGQANALIGEVPQEHRRLIRFVLALHHQRLDRVVAMGPRATRRAVRDDPMACLRLLVGGRKGVPAQRGETRPERSRGTSLR